MLGRNIDVLLVEDDEAIRETLAEVLQDEGFAVQTAGHGARALELLDEGLRPKIILLDLMMPVMDGWQLLVRLQEAPAYASIPAIVVSAARDVLPAGAKDYLNKPLDIETLLDALQRHLPELAQGTARAEEAQAGLRLGPGAINGSLPDA